MMNKKWHIQNVLNSKPLLIQPNLKSGKKKKICLHNHTGNRKSKEVIGTNNSVENNLSLDNQVPFHGTKFLRSLTKNFYQILESISSDLWILSASVLINYITTNKQEYISESGIIDIAISVRPMIYCT